MATKSIYLKEHQLARLEQMGIENLSDWVSAQINSAYIQMFKQRSLDEEMEAQIKREKEREEKEQKEREIYELEENLWIAKKEEIFKYIQTLDKNQFGTKEWFAPFHQNVELFRSNKIRSEIWAEFFRVRKQNLGY